VPPGFSDSDHDENEKFLAGVKKAFSAMNKVRNNTVVNEIIEKHENSQESKEKVCKFERNSYGNKFNLIFDNDEVEEL